MKIIFLMLILAGHAFASPSKRPHKSEFLKTITENTSDEDLVKYVYLNENLPDDRKEYLASEISKGKVTVEAKHFLSKFNEANKIELARHFKKSMKKNPELVEEEFFNSISDNVSFQFLDKARAQGLLKVRVCKYDGSHGGLSGHLLFGGALGFDCGKYSSALILGVGPGLAYVAEDRLSAIFLCIGEERTFGIGADVAAGFIGGISFGAWIGNGVCVSLMAGRIYGAYARASYIGID